MIPDSPKIVLVVGPAAFYARNRIASMLEHLGLTVHRRSFEPDSFYEQTIVRMFLEWRTESVLTIMAVKTRPLDDVRKMPFSRRLVEMPDVVLHAIFDTTRLSVSTMIDRRSIFPNEMRFNMLPTETRP